MKTVFFSVGCFLSSCYGTRTVHTCICLGILRSFLGTYVKHFSVALLSYKLPVLLSVAKAAEVAGENLCDWQSVTDM